MLHSNVGQTNFIGHNFVGIYETTPIGNLDKIRFVEDMTFPLQKAYPELQANYQTQIEREAKESAEHGHYAAREMV